MQQQHALPRKIQMPPVLPGLPILGSALEMQRDPLRLFLDGYKKFGPVFRVNALHRHFTIMAGIEANQFLAKEGERYLGSERLFGGFAKELETDHMLVALDGEPHRAMRKLMRRGFSREAIVPHLGDATHIVWDFVRQWPTDKPIPVLNSVQRMVTEQIGAIVMGRPPGEYYEDIKKFLYTLMNVTVMKSQPQFLLRSPGYLKAKARVFELGYRLLAEERAAHEIGKAVPLLADMLDGVDAEGKKLPDEALLTATISPYFAGMDTVASTFSFMIYALLNSPDVMAQLEKEVDAVFDKGIPTLDDLKSMKKLYGATLEILRMYPVAAFIPRTANEDFEFNGYRIPAGTDIIVATGVTHYLPQYFPEPEKFDVTRYSEPRKEHRQAFIYAPYGLGAHTCLGAGLAEVQVMITTAALLRAVRLKIDPPGWKMSPRMTPLPSPGRNFKVRIAERRQPVSAH